MQINPTKKPPIPLDGWAGLKQNIGADLSSGFIIFLLALPLSLGIAKASDVPPIMGLVSAIIGGVVITFFTGSKLAIKGPAAGLIVIIAGAVADFGGGSQGWQLAAGAMVVAGLLQILFGLLRFGKFVDFFPLAAIHGMLAAIGLIIIAKQIPVLLNVDPAVAAGHGPVGLFAMIPTFVQQMDVTVALLGVVSLAIMLWWSRVPVAALRRLPAPLVVLLVAIPGGIYLDLAAGPSYSLLKVGNIVDSIAVNASFDGVSQASIFTKYVIMMALVGSLESLLTVKAVDLLDPYQRRSDTNKDLIAIGIGNTLAAVLGGIPMISEVARSSANVKNGAQTRWANFFHGVFLLLFAVAAYPLLEMIPNAALAAMLIAVGYNLAHPREFVHTFKIGRDQLAIFVVTIVVTLLEDLLLGIGAGILLKLVLHALRGAPVKTLFRADVSADHVGELTTITIGSAAVFSNYLAIKKQLDAIPYGRLVIIHIKDDTQLVDHSSVENLLHFKDDYESNGGRVDITGLDALTPLSAHPLATRARQLQ